MRQIVFLLTYFGLFPTIVLSPFAGFLIYKWLEYLKPADTYYVTLLPDQLAFSVAAVTILMWLTRMWLKLDDRALPRAPLLLGLLAAFFLWTNFTSLFALVPEAAAFKWERTAKVIGFSLVAAQMLSTRARIEALLWVQVICIAYSAIPGALKTIYWGGGGETVIGVTGSFIEDRVEYAVMLSLMLPLTLFLARQTTLLPRTRWLILGLRGTALTFLISLVGTFARTALFTGGTALFLLVFKSRNKIATVLAAGAMVVLLFYLAPERWFERMDTTVEYTMDASATNRIAAWEWSWRMALEHPFMGGGFRVFVLNKTTAVEPGYLEAHNIFFEVVAEHGFIGLALFCWLIAAAYASCGAVRRLGDGHPDLAWARDLAGMLQISVLVFVAGGMFVSIATSPFLYDLVLLSIGLRSVVERERARLQFAEAVADRAAPPLPVPPTPASA
jgi:probable O-glycosylation ligase (exosortase A-associated)